ncbi:unnamed protein product [Sphagnum tenellum]
MPPHLSTSFEAMPDVELDAGANSDIDGKIGQAHHDKACSLDNNIVVVFQNGRMVNYKVEELRLGLEKNKNNPMMMIMVYHWLLQESNIATDSTLNSSSANNHCLAALSSAEVGTHKSIPIAFLDAYMKDEGPAIDSNLGQYEDAVSVLERSLTIPDVNQGEQHALAIFAGHMQLGDALNLAGKQGPAMEFVDAKKMCGHALLIHTNHCDSGSLEEDQYHKLLVTIHTAEGDHGKALDSLVVPPETNKPGEAKSYCEAALWSYGKQGAGHTPGDVAHGLADTAAILEELNKRLPFSSCNRLSTSLTNHQDRGCHHLLEEMLEVKEEKLGTMHLDVEEEGQCVHKLLNQQGCITSHKKSRKLVELLSNVRKVF